MEVPTNQQLRDSIEYYTKTFKPFMKKLTEEERKTLLMYKAIGFIEINRSLYGEPYEIDKDMLPWFNKKQSAKKLFEESVVRHIQTLDSLFAKVPKRILEKQPKIVYRGSSEDSIQGLKKGMELTTKGYLSTSLFPHVATGFIGCEGCCLFKFILNKPVPYMYLPWNLNSQAESLQSSEHEILLVRNLKFKVLEVQKVSLPKDDPYCSIELIKKSQKKKLTMYVCELEEVLEDRSIPDVEIKIV